MDFSQIPFKTIAAAEATRFTSELIALLSTKFSGISELQPISLVGVKHYEDNPAVREISIHLSKFPKAAVQAIIDEVSRDTKNRFNKSFSNFCASHAILEAEHVFFPQFVAGESRVKDALTPRKLAGIRGKPFDRPQDPEENSEEILYSPIKGFGKLSDTYKIPSLQNNPTEMTLLYKGVKVNIVEGTGSPSYRLAYSSFGEIGSYIGMMMAFFGVTVNARNAYVEVTTTLPHIEKDRKEQIIVFREISEMLEFLGMSSETFSSIRKREDAIKVLASAKLFHPSMFESLQDVESRDFNFISFSELSDAYRPNGLAEKLASMSEDERVAMTINYAGLKKYFKNFGATVSKESVINQCTNEAVISEIIAEAKLDASHTSPAGVASIIRGTLSMSRTILPQNINRDVLKGLVISALLKDTSEKVYGTI